MKPEYAIKNYFNFRIAIIEMGFGENKEDAWSRHLSEHPEDTYANIKIFNRDSRIPRPLQK